MKKFFLSIALLVAGGISAKAQLVLGAKGGVNFSKINSDNIKESTLTGYQVGIFIRGGSTFYVQPEAYISSTGGKFDFQSNNTSTSGSGQVRFTNLNIPLLIGRSFGAKDLNFRVMAGPIYTAILNQDESIPQNITDSKTYSDFGTFKKSTLGFQAGAGVDISAFTIDFRYEGGLTKLNEKYGQRQNLWALSVGIKLL
ncbi:PorT family protein [Mucilaginibacter sp. RS28]|uniref:PorT family protein n=1 Tax=Mucilaginibacter straminoryzae TaxID=2932774 RepID=A0A9X1X874_9SPHI|nr:porin family protein [Mucilaginibacter straminoryzae]MCJ8211960.1 PorT family protein [Mucilaginibacter straminoryzae]